MGLPKAVQRMAEQADQMVEEIIGKAGDEPAIAETGTVPEQQVEQPAQQQAPAPEVVEKQSSTDWEHKYRTIQSKFDAEVPRLHSNVRDLTKRVNDLLAELEIARTKTAAPIADLVTQSDKETFGQDLSDFIERAAKQATSVVERENAELKARLARLENNVGTVAETTQEALHNDYLAALGRMVPDWEAQNVDQGFLDWLAQVDPLLGAPRQAGLAQAFEQRDVARTAAIFRAYRPAAPTKADPKAELSRQVAPARTRSAPPPQSNEAPYLTESQIAGHYRAFREGRMSEADFVAGEAQIQAAIAENRVRPG